MGSALPLHVSDMSGRCRFPSCGAVMPIQHADDHRYGLCFDHRQMAYYDWDGFVRLWQSRRSLEPGAASGAGPRWPLSRAVRP
jgi:hypothetical protein